MALWLIVIAILVVAWLALAPRTGKTALRTRNALTSRVPLSGVPIIGKGTDSQKFKLALTDAISARGSQLNSESPASMSAFSAWVNGLSEQDLKSLQSEVTDACHHSNVDINWLLDGSAEGDSKRALQDTVLFHALAVWRSDSLQAFERLESYLKDPEGRSNRDFGQQLFAKLVTAGTIVIPANMMLAPEKERRAFAAQQIQAAAQTDQNHVVSVARDVLAEGKNGKKAVSSSQPAPAPAPTPAAATTPTEPKSLPANAEVSA